MEDQKSNTEGIPARVVKDYVVYEVHGIDPKGARGCMAVFGRLASARDFADEQHTDRECYVIDVIRDVVFYDDDRSMCVIGDAVRPDHMSRAEIRKRALAKLTQEELEALGLS